MNHIEYFKLQAKNLLRDYKTQTPYIEGGDTQIKGSDHLKTLAPELVLLSTPE